MKWLLLCFVLYAPLSSTDIEKCPVEKEQLYLSMNIAEGEKLLLSDRSIYEIAPSDRIYSAYWITPFPIELSESGDPNYPIRITNLQTGSFVRAKQLVASEVIEEERQKELKRRQPNGESLPVPQTQPTPKAPQQEDLS